MKLEHIPYHKHTGNDAPQIDPKDQNKLPIWASPPTHNTQEGKYVLVNESGVYNLYAFIDGDWRNLTNNT